MEIVMDLHLHSKFSRAVSKRMTLENMYLWGVKKGINLLSVGDFTHPEWYRILQQETEEEQDGIYTLKKASEIEREYKEFFTNREGQVRFMLTTEVSLIYSQDDKTHRAHLLIFAPDMKTVGAINKTFLRHDLNLRSDGRPIFGLSCIDLCEMLFSISADIHIIPAHVWTPWFSVYGSKSGFDSIDVAFGKYSDKIFAVESGLSSDPVMNWRIPELDSRSIVSFGDAHSFYKMGREATVLRIKNKELRIKNENRHINYKDIVEGLKKDGKGPFEIGYTIEFYPEEGKYHFTGHRACGVVHSPSETKMKGVICPVCGKSLTVGVMQRVEDLAKKSAGVIDRKDENGVVWQKDEKGLRPSYVSLVPLQEIISEVVGRGVNTKTVLSLYDLMISKLGSEFEILLRVPLSRIEAVGGKKMAEAVARVRSRDIVIEAGHDGVFGKVGIWEEKEEQDNQLGFKL